MEGTTLTGLAIGLALAVVVIVAQVLASALHAVNDLSQFVQ